MSLQFPTRRDGRSFSILLKGVDARVFPVGRLDYASEGLLLLTNDGELMQQLTKTASHVPKTYQVKVSGAPTEEQIEQAARRHSLAAGDFARGNHGRHSSRHAAPHEIRAHAAGQNRSGAPSGQSLVRGDVDRRTQPADPPHVRADWSSRREDQARPLRFTATRCGARRVAIFETTRGRGATQPQAAARRRAPAPESAAAERSAHPKRPSVLPDHLRARALATAQARRVFIPVRSRGHNRPNNGHRRREWEPPHVARDLLRAAVGRKIVGSLPVRARIVRRRGVRSARSSHAGNSAPRTSALLVQNAEAAALIAEAQAERGPLTSREAQAEAAVLIAEDRPELGPSTEHEPQAEAVVLIAEDRPERGASTRREAPRARPEASKGHRGRHRVLLHAALVRQIVSSSPAHARIVRSRGVRKGSSNRGRNSAPRANDLRGQSAQAVALIAEAQPGRGPSTRIEAPRVLPGAGASPWPVIADHLGLRVVSRGIKAVASRAAARGY